GGRLVTADGRTLALRGATLRAEARAGLVRVVLEQRFANTFAEPLAVTYLMPLPADGAVSGYAFTIGDKRIVGEVDRRQAARERFEEAIASGRSAALVEEERSSLFTQEIGNIPPNSEVIAELIIDQKLRWLDEGAWEWRFPTVAMPRYVGGPGRVDDAARTRVDVADGPLPVRATLSLQVRDRLLEGRRAESPSHALAIGGDGAIALVDEGGARLDRDLVVRWPVAAAEPGLTLDVARPADGKPHATNAYGLLTLVPPARGAGVDRAKVARDLCFLIDTSGSMSGEPLAQACRVMEAMIDTLGDDDLLEMIEFSSAPRRWKRKPVRADQKARAEARAWLRALSANGSTEMRAALMEALAPLRDESQRQIVLVSDGAIGFESEIVADVLAKLPRASRLHTVGVGSGVNRSLTAPAARAGRGVEVIIGIGEDPERAAQRICARTAAPLVVDLVIEGSALVEAAPARLPDLFAGAPALCGLALRPTGGELVARGRTAEGEWRQRIEVAPIAAGAGNGAVVALFGRERVEDLEMRLCAGEAVEAPNAIDRMIEKVGLEFQIATRLTSWVAVADEPAVDPKAPTRKQRIPQELPFGVSVEGLGLRAAGAPMPARAMMPGQLMNRTRAFGAATMRGAFTGGAPPTPPAAPSRPAPTSAQGKAVGEKTKMAKREEGEAARYFADELAEVAPAPLEGRVVRAKDGEIVVEIDVHESGTWSVADEVDVEDAQGRIVRASVDRARTTADGELVAGQTIRLVLRIEGAVALLGARVRSGTGIEIVIVASVV
ncbi:MAG TPA: VIT domain-containing protein, partial [Polyangia bacterium]